MFYSVPLLALFSVLYGLMAGSSDHVAYGVGLGCLVTGSCVLIQLEALMFFFVFLCSAMG
jgi:hypothetical protein